MMALFVSNRRTAGIFFRFSILLVQSFESVVSRSWNNRGIWWDSRFFLPGIWL